MTRWRCPWHDDTRERAAPPLTHPRVCRGRGHVRRDRHGRTAWHFPTGFPCDRFVAERCTRPKGAHFHHLYRVAQVSLAQALLEAVLRAGASPSRGRQAGFDEGTTCSGARRWSESAHASSTARGLKVVRVVPHRTARKNGTDQALRVSWYGQLRRAHRPGLWGHGAVHRCEAGMVND